MMQMPAAGKKKKRKKSASKTSSFQNHEKSSSLGVTDFLTSPKSTALVPSPKLSPLPFLLGPSSPISDPSSYTTTTSPPTNSFKKNNKMDTWAPLPSDPFILDHCENENLDLLNGNLSTPLPPPTTTSDETPLQDHSVPSPPTITLLSDNENSESLPTHQQNLHYHSSSSQVDDIDHSMFTPLNSTVPMIGYENFDPYTHNTNLPLSSVLG